MAERRQQQQQQAPPVAGGGGGAGEAAQTTPTTAFSSLSLPVAAQPDMVLAWEKDGFYAKEIHQQLKDVAEVLVGARRVELLGPEVEALGDLLYFGLTILGGAETLGQEYCHLMFVEERGGGSHDRQQHRFLPLSRLRRATLVGATVVCNYVSERLLHREGWSSDYAQLLRARRPRPRRRATTQEQQRELLMQQQQLQIQQLQQQQRGGGRGRMESLEVSGAGEGDGAAETEGREPQPFTAAWAVARVQAALRRLARSVSALVAAHRGLLRTLLPESREAALRALARLHLMLFFFNGRFYSLATRLAGARTMFIREQLEGGRRASYFIMGAFILLEMGLRGLASAVAAVARLLEARRQARLQEQQRQRQGLEDGEPPTLGAAASDGGGLGPSPVVAPGGIKPSASFARALQTEARVPSGVHGGAPGGSGGTRSRSWSMASDGGGGVGVGGSSGGIGVGGGPGASGGGALDEQKKCALCMSQRRAPAVTPCGHCFCWRCILAWCAEQPECPLCRAKVLPQSILHVVNLGFPGDAPPPSLGGVAGAGSSSSFLGGS